MPEPGEPISFVKLVMQYFAEGKHGRKVEIKEFQALTETDKTELRQHFIDAGYNVAGDPSSAAT